jgi:hypothetical protein
LLIWSRACGLRVALVSRPMDLVEIGFWSDPRNLCDRRGHPRDVVDSTWDKTSRYGPRYIGKTRVLDTAAAYTSCRLLALEYLRHGYLESFELAPSFCRFGCNDGNPHPMLGCATLTDGSFIWPEGCVRALNTKTSESSNFILDDNLPRYVHYVEKHHVRPPQNFIDHILLATHECRHGVWQWESDGNTSRVPVATLRALVNLGSSLPQWSQRDSMDRWGNRCMLIRQCCAWVAVAIVCAWFVFYEF